MIKILLMIIILTPIFSYADCGDINRYGWQIMDGSSSGSTTTWRMSVPSGWLIESVGSSYPLTFVPDGDHLWKLQCMENKQ